MSTVSIADANRHLSQLINRAAYGSEVVVLTSRGQAKAVLLGIDAFESLVGMGDYANRPLLPLETLQDEFGRALAAAGYDSRDKIVDLVRDVKREMLADREQALVPA